MQHPSQTLSPKQGQAAGFSPLQPACRAHCRCSTNKAPNMQQACPAPTLQQQQQQRQLQS